MQFRYLARPSPPRASATCAACEAIVGVGRGTSGEPQARRAHRCRRLAGQDGEELRSEAGELDVADAGDAAHRVEGLRPHGRHLDQRAVGEDHVGRHAAGVGERPALGLECGEQPLVLGRDQRRWRGAHRRACRATDAVGAELERRLAAEQRPRLLGQAQRAVAGGVGTDEVEAHQLAEDRLPFGLRPIGADAEGRQAVVAAGEDLFAALAAQDRDQVLAAEALAGPEDRREGHPRRLGCVEELGRVAAEVAVAAGLLHGLAEVGEERLPPAVLGLGEAEEGVEPLVVGLLALHRRRALVDLRAAEADVVGAVERQRVGGRAVAAGAADLLVVALDRLRQVGVGDVADVGLVDAHAEGDRRADDQPVLALEAGLGEAAVVGREAGMVGERRVSGLAERRGEALGAGAARAVDDARLTAPGGDAVEDLPARIVLGREGEREVRPVEAAQEDLRRARRRRAARRSRPGSRRRRSRSGRRSGCRPPARRSSPMRR